MAGLIHLLLVDDDDDDVVHLRTTLGALVEVQHVRTGLEAWAVGLRGELPHVVLVDVDLPGEDGRELARMMRADPRTAATPVYTWSGDAEARADLWKGDDQAVVDAVRDAAQRAREPSVMTLVVDRLTGLEEKVQLIDTRLAVVLEERARGGKSSVVGRFFREACEHTRSAVAFAVQSVLAHPMATLGLALVVAVVVMVWDAVPERVTARLWDAVGIEYVAQHRRQD